MKRRIIALVLAVATVGGLGYLSADEAQRVSMENDALRVVLDGKTGAFVSVYNKSSGQELVQEAERWRVPWELTRKITRRFAEHPSLKAMRLVLGWDPSDEDEWMTTWALVLRERREEAQDAAGS